MGSRKKGGSGIAGSLHGAANLSKIWHKSVTDVALDILRINLFYTVKISTFCRWGVRDGEVLEGGEGGQRGAKWGGLFFWLRGGGALLSWTMGKAGEREFGTFWGLKEGFWRGGGIGLGG